MIRIRLPLKLILVVLIFSASLLGEKAKPNPKVHPEPSTGQRKSLDQLTQAVSARLPSAPSITVSRKNFIDAFIFGKMEADRVPHAGLSSDTEFLRRVTLDLTGRLPEVEAIRAFVKDPDP